MPVHANVTLHRILATLVVTRAQHIHTVRQKKQELTRNNRVRILLIRKLLCFGQHGRADSTFKFFKEWIAIMTITYAFFLQWYCMLRHSVCIAVKEKFGEYCLEFSKKANPLTRSFKLLWWRLELVSRTNESLFLSRYCFTGFMKKQNKRQTLQQF